LLIVLYFGQGRMIYFPDSQVVGSPADYGLPYEDLSLTAADGTQIHAWYVPAPGDRATLLFCHGNAGNIGSRLPYLPIFQRLGISTLLFDYRGYGRSEGQPTEQGTYQDAAAAWQYLNEVRGIPHDRLVVYGESLGGAIAAHLAEQHPSPAPKALVLASTFISLNQRASELYPFMPIALISQFGYNVRDRLPQIAAPVLVIHSTEDEIIPYHHGQALYQAAREPKTLITLRGSHNEGIFDSLELYQRGLEQFLFLGTG
jgi:alpha-beta hydrolase superfamily lysophospholipase